MLLFPTLFGGGFVALGALRAERVSDLVTTALQEYLSREFPETEGDDFREWRVQASTNLAGGLACTVDRADP